MSEKLLEIQGLLFRKYDSFNGLGRGLGLILGFPCTDREFGKPLTRNVFVEGLTEAEFAEVEGDSLVYRCFGRGSVVQRREVYFTVSGKVYDLSMQDFSPWSSRQEESELHRLNQTLSDTSP